MPTPIQGYCNHSSWRDEGSITSRHLCLSLLFCSAGPLFGHSKSDLVTSINLLLVLVVVLPEQNKRLSTNARFDVFNHIRHALTHFITARECVVTINVALICYMFLEKIFVCKQVC